MQQYSRCKMLPLNKIMGNLLVNAEYLDFDQYKL